jgi:hypothetical protein
VELYLVKIFDERITRAATAAIVFLENPALDQISDVSQRRVG